MGTGIQREFTEQAHLKLFIDLFDTVNGKLLMSLGSFKKLIMIMNILNILNTN